MKSPKISGVLTSKRALIDKANTTTLIAAGVAAFLVVFSLVASKALISQAMYQNRVIAEKKLTLDKLEKNIKARDELVKSYELFVSMPQNVIKGNTQGTGERDGDNGKIILDALPSKYDFPALTASLEKLAQAQGLEIGEITGTDDEVAQAEQQSSAAPKPVPMAFELSVEGGYPQIQALIISFEKSIRPMQAQKQSFISEDGSITSIITAQTFYQPEKLLELTTKVIK